MSTDGSNSGIGGGGGGGGGSERGASNFGASGHGGSMVSVGGFNSSHGGGGNSGGSNEISSHPFESQIAKMKRFISSPLTRRKSTSQASTESAPPMISSSTTSSSSSSSKHLTENHHKIFGTPIEKLTHQRSFNEMSSSSISHGNYGSSSTSSSHHLSASSYSTMRSMSTSGLPGSFLFSSSSSSPPTTTTSSSASTLNLGHSSTLGQGTVFSTTTTNTTTGTSSSKKVIYDKEATVPFVITRLCHYIEDSQGLMQEGLFRTSGNARLIEKLKTSFDCNGDAPLETEGDIPSAAALLKLFLRELPVPLIPQSIHCLFLDTVQDTLNRESYDKDAFIGRIKVLVENLPDENYFLLKYLSRFLYQVARHETYNRMNPSSLGIIFGPNIFRVAAEDYRGLREQSLTNQVVTFFITDYETIFGADLSPDNNNNQELNLSTTNQQSVTENTIDIGAQCKTVNQSKETETIRKLENSKGKVIIVSIDSVCCNKSTPDQHKESTTTTPMMLKKDDIDDETKDSNELSDDQHFTPLQIDIPPIDCDQSDSSSVSPTLACSSISPCPIDSKDYILTIESLTDEATTSPLTTEITSSKTTVVKQSSNNLPLFLEGIGKRKDRKYILSSSSNATVRSSSEERKPLGSSTKLTSCTGQTVDQEVRRCNSYQDVAKGEHSTRNSYRQVIKSSNLSSDSVNQSPEPKRREIDSSSNTINNNQIIGKGKSKLSRSTLSFESRPCSLDLTGKSHQSASESKSEPTVRGKVPVAPSGLSTDSNSQSTSGEHHHHYHHHQPLLSSLSSSTYLSRNTHSISSEVSVNHPNAESRVKSSELSSSSSQQQKVHSVSSSNLVNKKVSSSSSSLPHIDYNALHKNAEGESAMVSDLRYSWSSVNESQSAESLLEEEEGVKGEGFGYEDDDNSVTQSDSSNRDGVKPTEPVQNAAVQILRRRNTYEAPLSPSAYRGLLGQRAPHLDHTIPPSPPGEQEHHFHGNKSGYNHESTIVKEAKRKIHNLKRRLKQFERDFEKENGYRPSHEQKMKSDVAQPLLFELNKFRKMLREYKEDARVTIEFYEGVFNEMQRSLKERRYCVGRPETIAEMSIDQIFDEKLDLQKSLLKYESVFGRPCRREDRTVMKPLYDRYRTIRNLVSKIPKNKDLTDLQPILEHVAMNFTSPSHSPKGSLDAKDEDADEDKGRGRGSVSNCGDDDDYDDDTSSINSNRVKKLLLMDKEGGNDRENDSNNANHNDASNQNVDDNNNETKLDLSDNNNNNNYNNNNLQTQSTPPKLEAISRIKLKESNTRHFIKGINETTAINQQSSSSYNKNLCHNLHELPPSELIKELALVRREKSELREIIRSFEDDFIRTNGRKVNEFEKSQLESVYTNYKACKKKLRLLEVFIEKYEKRRMES